MAKSDMTVKIDVEGLEVVEQLAAKMKELEQRCEVLEHYISGASEQFVSALAEKVARHQLQQVYLRTGVR